MKYSYHSVQPIHGDITSINVSHGVKTTDKCCENPTGRAEKLDYYTILSVKPGDNSDEVKEAFRKLAKKYHPDMVEGTQDAEVRTNLFGRWH